MASEERIGAAGSQSLTALFFCTSHRLRLRSGGPPAQRRVLRILKASGEMSQQALQDQLGIRPGSISELLAKMEERGLIERAQSSQDRRRRVLRITKEGLELIQRSPEEEDSTLFGKLSEEERGQLRQLLSKLAQE